MNSTDELHGKLIGIGELGRILCVPESTLRFWEERGEIVASCRVANHRGRYLRVWHADDIPAITIQVRRLKGARRSESVAD